MDEDTSDASLDPDITNDDWAAEIARREGELGPAVVARGPLRVTDAKRPAAQPKRPGITAPEFVTFARAIEMVRKSLKVASIDGAALRLVAAIRDPRSAIATRGADGRSMSGSEWVGLTPDVRRLVLANGARELPMRQVMIAYLELVTWLGADVLSKDGGLWTGAPENAQITPVTPEAGGAGASRENGAEVTHASSPMPLAGAGGDQQTVMELGTPISGHKKPFDVKQAALVLVGLKVGKVHARRPNETEGRSALAPHFETAPRDKVREAIVRAWGEGKRGPRGSAK